MWKRTLAAVAVILLAPVSAWAGIYDLTVGKTTINVAGKDQTAMTINGSLPGPVLRFKEGEDLTINVTNTLAEDTSIHWHGLLLPYRQDGVPGISFPGIKPGETFTYRFPAQQAGTYWYHSHSGMQEAVGMYGAMVIEPKAREPFRYDREYVIVLSDWHPDDSPRTILSNLKMSADYYNYQQRTLGTFLDDAKKTGFGATLSDRMDWGDMRMVPSDIADVSGFVFLMNGRNMEQNWTGLFKPGERVRLRIVNAAAMTFFDIRIPGLKMTVVQADGNSVRPVPVDEFRIAVAETYDVIVRPTENKAFSILAESMARTGFARGTLAPQMGMAGDIPSLRPKQFLTMADMAGHGGMDHGSMNHGAASGGVTHTMPDGTVMKGTAQDAHAGHAMPGQATHTMPDGTAMAGMDHSAHGAMAMTDKADPFYAPGSGLMPKAADGGKFLSYADLKAFKPLYPDRPAGRVIEVRLTGNMERYVWSINGVKYSDAEPIRLKFGERVRFKFVNETMMTHPMHLHGMWQILDNGSGKYNPAKHTISIAPGKTVEADVEADAEGQWAFHCHLMYHMAAGMFRKVVVERETAEVIR
ncbi:MAG: copper oxidase [Rhodospirillales bacterium CG15_BIG_FIL_POST_REV_8_21_14_020_66_15]|nr:MAG: copper oxidase [Rhodospirillales bacterium CG15_BIG_FIL_POST_REV_8_21_14_020_66_15]